MVSYIHVELRSAVFNLETFKAKSEKWFPIFPNCSSVYSGFAVYTKYVLLKRLLGVPRGMLIESAAFILSAEP